MSDIAWLAVAVGAVWLGIGAYVASISVRQKRIESRLAQLEERSPRRR